MGGGRSKFLPNTTKDWQNKSGQRIDNRNLIKEWLNINRAGGARTAYVNNRTELKSLKTNETDYLFGNKSLLSLIGLLNVLFSRALDR